MKTVDYANMSIDDLIIMDKVDICQVKKHFKADLINLDDRFIRFKTFTQKLIVGQWVVFINYNKEDKMDIVFTAKISEILEKEYFCSPRDVNEFLDNLKKDRMKIKKGYTLTINTDFSAYDEYSDTFSDTLLGSCMNGCAERYYDLRDCMENPDDMQICLVRDYEGNLVARSLIWKNTCYDRIYANNTAIVNYVKSVLDEKGFTSVYYAPTYRLDVPLSTELGDNPVPYMDSVAYYRESPLQISTNSWGHSACLQETDGESCFNRARCGCCGEWAPISGMYYIERADSYICSDCSYEIVFTADTDQYEYIDDCVSPVDRDNDWYYYADDLFLAVDTNNYYKDNDDLYYAEDAGEYYSDADILYFATDTGNYYKDSDNLYFAEDTKEWYEYSDELFYNASKEIYIKGDL